MKNRPIKRLAFLCPGTDLPRWQGQAMRQVLTIPGVELVGLGLPLHARTEDHPGGLLGYLQRRNLALLSGSALLPDDISEIRTSAPLIEFADSRPSASEVQQMSAWNADAIFSFLPEPYQGQVYENLPIWQFLLNEQPMDGRGSVNLSSAILRQTNARAKLIGLNGAVGAEAEFSVKRDDGTLGIDTLLHGASWLPAKLVMERSIELNENINKASYTAIEQTSITSEVSFFLRCELMRWRAERNKSSVPGSWNIGILHQPISALLEPEPSMNIRWLSAPSNGNQRMEPFGYTAPDGQLNVLYRKKDRSKAFDTVARLRPKSDSVLKRSRSMLTTQADLEYPFVLERPDGAYVVIGYPHQGRTELFKVASTNDGLDHLKILLHRALSSPTLTEFDGRWWLFGTDPDAADTVLLAFHSDRFSGPYTAHTRNPLKIGPVGTRPAGTMFMHEGALWRPALDPTLTDSTAVILNKVEVLTPDEFLETPFKRIDGFRGTVYGNGVRTLCAMGDITLIDGVRLATPSRPPKRPHDTDSDDE